MDGVQLHGQHQGRLLAQPKGHKVFAFQMQRGGFLKMLNGVIQCPPLCNDGNFKTFGDITSLITGSNHSFYGLLQIAHEVLLLVATTEPENNLNSSREARKEPRLTSVADALNQTTTFEYNEVGNLIATVDPLGNRTLRFYDAVSRLIAIVDGRGKGTQFTYDNLNRITQIEDAINGITAFTYDPNGNLLTLTDAKNQTTTYTYDTMDRLATRKDARNRTESYVYDLAGNLSTFTDRKNQITTFQYDPLDRRTSTSYADSTSITAAYDAVGNVTKLTDSATGAIDWTYDVLDRLTQEVTPQGIVRYSYDAISQRLTMRANAQPPVTYHYDANSQLAQVEQGTLSAILTHDALGQRTQLQRSNGVTTTYNYDPASRLLGIIHAKGSTVLEQLAHGFDQADNKTQATQLIQTATAIPPAVTAAYNAVNAQIQFNSGTLGYDPNGNLTTDGTTTYVWDVRDRLIGITGDGPPSGTGTVPVSATFRYDALDRRIAKTINGSTTSYVYDGADIAIEAGASNASYLSTLNIDEPIVRQTSTGNEYYHTDDLGSTLALTNDAGALTTTYMYGPFGATTVTGTSTNPFQFTGRENDGNGLYYYRARYYSPAQSRFITEDSLRFGAGDMNLYAYVFNNPIRSNDPTGQIAPLLLACGAGSLITLPGDLLGVLSGRKTLTALATNAALGCAGGAAGLGAAKALSSLNNLRKGFQKAQNALPIDSKQLGKKFGRHMDPNIPGYRNPQEYRDLANKIYNDPSAVRTVLPNGEIQIQLGNDLLRLTPDGKFRSLYPIAGGG